MTTIASPVAQLMVQSGAVHHGAGEDPHLAPIPWEEARSRLGDAHSLWFASSRPDGRPHVRPVLGVWVDGALHTTSGPRTRKTRNLLNDPRCAITVGTEDMDIVLEGAARRVRDEARLQQIADAYRTKYGWPPVVVGTSFDAPYGAPTAGPPPCDVFEIIPDVAFGFGTTETFAPRSTRWSF